MSILFELYDILNPLYENQNTLIYNAIRKADNKKVIIKSYKSPEDVQSIKYEYGILKNKNISGVSNVLGIVDEQEKYYLISEDKNAVVLDTYIKENEVSEKDFIVIAKNAANALASIHDRNIIHRDIKPSNILINPRTLMVWYIDFGIAIINDESNKPKFESIKGTLDYISPEQTGRINTAVDFRSDLYSLGVTFYKIITGSLPFTGDNKMELIHAHIAVLPAPPTEITHINGVVSDIVMKLLNKSPLQRYQSAGSLAYDLSVCCEYILSNKDVEPFVLGEKDILLNLEHGRKLYGKSHELDRLKQIFSCSISAHSELVILSGAGDVGKTTLINEFEKYISAMNGYSIKVKFEQIENNEPYYAIREAFKKFELALKDLNSLMLLIKDEIINTLGSNTQALINVLPDLAPILGKQAPLVKLGYTETQKRTEQVFKSFLKIISKTPYPIVFVLDNVQWADYFSLKLFVSAIEGNDINNLLVVWINRSGEPNSGYNLELAMKDIEKTNITVSRIELKNLDINGTREMLDDLFAETAYKTDDLAEFVFRSTQGNILKIEVFLKQLYEKKQIVYDNDSKTWQWDIDSILAETPDIDVNNLHNNILPSFSKETTDLFNILVCWGFEFNLYEVIDVCKLDIDINGTLKKLSQVFHDGILIYNKRLKTYTFENIAIHNMYYKNIPDSEKSRIHFMIGSNLYKKYRQDENALDEYCIQITNHINFADISDAHNGILFFIAELNLMSGDKTMLTSNTYQAIKFYNRGISCLGEDPFSKNYKVAFDLYLGYAACEHLLNNNEESVKIYNMLHNNVVNDTYEYTLYKKRTLQYLSSGNYARAFEISCDYLEKHHIIYCGNNIQPGLENAEYDFFINNLAEKDIYYFLEVGLSKSEEALMAGSILALATEACYLDRQDDSDFFVYKALNYAFDNGTFPEFERAFALSAARRSRIGDYERAKQIIECGLKYAEIYNVPQCTFWNVYGLSVSHWVNPIEETLAIYKNAKKYALIEGNSYYSAYCDLIALNYYLYIGCDLNQVLEEVHSFIYNTKRLNITVFEMLYSCVYKQYAKCLLGKTYDIDTFDNKGFNEKSFFEINCDLDILPSIFYIYKMQALYIHGLFDKVIENAVKCQKYFANKRVYAHTSIVQYYFFYTLALAQICRKDESKRGEYIPVIKEHLDVLKGFADINPYNFKRKYLLASIEYKRIFNGDFSLIADYAKIEDLSKDSIFLLDKAIAEGLLASFWEDAGIPEYRQFHTVKEIEYYKQMKANVKVWQLSASLNYNTAGVNPLTFTVSETATTTSAAMQSLSNSNLDYETILNAISSLTSETGLDSLAKKLLNILMQNAGSDSGYVFLCDDSNISLSAYSHMQNNINVLNRALLPVAIEYIEDDVIPKKIIASVVARKQKIVVNEPENDYSFINDDYIKRNRPESFACLPIISKNKLIGVVYLENTKLSKMFSSERVDLLAVILLQASTLIQNVLYLADLKGYAKNLERRLNDYISQLNSLISGIAHEINSPIGVCVTVMTRMQEIIRDIIKSFETSSLSKNDLKSFLNESENGLDIVVNNITRAANLVQNFKKISVEQSSEVFEDLDLGVSIKNIIDYIRPAVKKKIGKINLICPDELIFNTSSGVLAQIFTNLMMNAYLHGFEHMDKEKCVVTIKIYDQHDDIQIIFMDNGKGMTEDELSKLFQPFFTTKRNVGGSGLGAHIVLTLVTQTLGGSINCVSSPRKGTTYIMQLPKKRI